MSLQYQLIDARRDSGLIAVSGSCNDSAKFRDQINKVTRILMKRGGWYGLEVLMKFCVYGCVVTFPRYVGTVIGMRTCCDQMDLKNHWYHIVGGRNCACQYESTITGIDSGQAPCYREITGEGGRFIVYHITKQADVGKTITIYGTKFGGQPLQEKNPDGSWRNGITLIATPGGFVADPETGVIDIGASTVPTTSTDLITKITHIVRQPTDGMAYLYELGPDANGVMSLLDLAVYEPNETNPMYRRMKIQNSSIISANKDSHGNRFATVECLVKLQYIPLVNDNDFLLVDDFDALAYGIQALKRDENGEMQEAEAFWAKAIRELNFHDRDKSPGQQVSVKVRVMGSNRMTVNPI